MKLKKALAITAHEDFPVEQSDSVLEQKPD